MSQAAKTSNYGFNINNINDAQHLREDSNWENLDAALTAAAPAHYNSTGIQGQMAYDGTYLYFCYAANTWARFTLSATSKNF